VFTGEDNEGAQRFYEKIGYARDREWVYRKRLKRVPRMPEVRGKT
jgi:ribosomal protein S18 acetylase RimI-like enzyme